MVLFNEANEKFLRSSISRCPATILAVNRTDNVIGRIIFLTISITNIKLMRASGVPIGIVWINMCFVIKLQANIIIMNHIENANENEILIWAVGVKMNGNSAMKFKVKMNRKITLIRAIVPLGAFSISVFISLLILFITMYFLLIKNLNFNVTVMGRRIVIHAELKIDEDGSKIENKFIIISKM